MIDEITPCIGLTGKSGYGKTHKAKVMLIESPRAIVYDMLLETKNFSYESLGYQIINGPVKGRELVDALSRPTFRICYRPANIEAELNYFCECLNWAGNLTVFFDECHLLTKNKLPDPLFNLIRTRRHYNIRLLLATQRPPNFHRDLFDLFDFIYAFRISNWAGIKYLEANGAGFNLDKLATLEVDEFIKLEL